MFDNNYYDLIKEYESYNDEKQYFQFQNSWGIGWGDNGYGYIPYSYILDKNLAYDLCSVRFFFT